MTLETTKNKFTFHGDGGALFIIYLVNALLTFITLGIYSFWAKVKVIKFIYQNTEFIGERFDYYGTGKERFIGFLKAVGIFLIFSLIMAGIFKLLSMLFDQNIAQIIITLIIYIIIVAFMPFILVGKERYRLSRSSWRNIRFKFTGNTKELFKEFIKGVLLCLITLGIYYPWFQCKLNKYFADHSQYGNQPFSYNADGKELFFIYLKGILLSIITLGIYNFWLRADLLKFYYKNLSFQNNKFSSEITGGIIFKTALISMLLVIFSFGIALPWVIIRNMKIYLNTINYEGDIDLSTIKADLDKKASALADGLSDAASALDIG